MIEDEALRLFAKRDALAKQLADVDKALNAVRSRYMRENGIWGISPAAFRTEVRRRAA